MSATTQSQYPEGDDRHHTHSSDTFPDYRAPLRNLLALNYRWVQDVIRVEPNFFKDSMATLDQSPHTLWIGCADSRVPESVITLARPSDIIFVHRNIANQVREDDPNGLSVLDFAVNHLRVQHVIVVGHSHCGGVDASLQAARRNISTPPDQSITTIISEPPNSPLNRWLEPLTRLLISRHPTENTDSDSMPLSVAVEINVQEQIRILAQTDPITRNREAAASSVQIHGWVYDHETGRLRVLRPVDK